MNTRDSQQNVSTHADVVDVVTTSTTLSSFVKTSSTSSSPASTVAKILSRNSNGTGIMTSSPSNEAELQLYRVMQRASLLAYYDTLLEMGGDDVQQLCDAGEEEFLEIMALVGMASKPLHVRRLQKALQEWVTNPAMFQTPLVSSVPSSPSSAQPTTPQRTPTPTPVAASSTHSTKETDKPTVPTSVVDNTCSTNPSPPVRGPPSPEQSPGSPLQLTPVLVESQISKLSEAAEVLVKSLPQFEPKPQNAKKKVCKELENVMNMPEEDPKRMEEIRKYAAIYGRFDCKRKPEKPLTLHEVSVNEAAAQICRFIPALLTRRDELFPLARQVVRDSGYHYSKGHSSFAPMYRTHSYNTNSNYSRNGEEHLTKRSRLDLAYNDLGDVEKIRRQERLEQISDELRILSDKIEELVQTAQQVRDTSDLITIQTLQQQMEVVQTKQTRLLIEQNDLLKQPLPIRLSRKNSAKNSSSGDGDRPDTDDTDSQFSFSNASSPSQEVGDSRDSLLREGDNNGSASNGPANLKNPGKANKQYLNENLIEDNFRIVKDFLNQPKPTEMYDSFYQEHKVQVIAASGGNIIAVANPALSMSAAVSDVQHLRPESPLSLTIDKQTPKLVYHKPD